MKFLTALLGFITAITLLPSKSEARFHHMGGPGIPFETWHRGYWFHGTYLGRAGWWWIMGPSWYYYQSPIYPYPPPGAEVIYVAQVPNAPPPPPEAAPGATVIHTVPAPPPSAATTTAPPVTSANGTSQAFSYYCEKSKNYYPIINACADGWLVTPVKPPKGS